MAEILDALTLAPQHFYANQSNIYLGLRTTYWTLRDARDGRDIARVQDMLWQIATALEQGGLLDAAAQMVADKGLLVFAVCSLEIEEGLEQIEQFLRRHPEFQREPVQAIELFGLAELISPDGDLRTLPCHLSAIGGMDGFYAAKLRRT